jgi:hypothetical protein
MKARQKCPVTETTTGCCSIEAPCIEEKQRVKQPAVRYIPLHVPLPFPYFQLTLRYLICMEILLLLVCSKLGGKKYINTDTDTQVRTHTVTQKNTHKHTSHTKNTPVSMRRNDRECFSCTEGGKHNRAPTSTHIMVLTSSVSYFGKRRAAPT